MPLLSDTGVVGRFNVTSSLRHQASEFFSETNDNSVAIQLTYAIARFLLAGYAEAREEHRQAVRT